MARWRGCPCLPAQPVVRGFLPSVRFGYGRFRAQPEQLHYSNSGSRLWGLGCFNRLELV